MSGRPRVEIRAWSGCPSHTRALEQVRAPLRELGLPDLPIDLRWVETHEDAARLRFIGSPTVAVDGRDILPGDDEQVALTCRVYRHRNGRISPVPDPQDLRDALRAAILTSHAQEAAS